jgi:dihydroneopterin aldolase
VLARPAVQSVTVTVHKPSAPITVPFGDVAVTIERERSTP